MPRKSLNSSRLIVRIVKLCDCTTLLITISTFLRPIVAKIQSFNQTIWQSIFEKQGFFAFVKIWDDSCSFIIYHFRTIHLANLSDWHIFNQSQAGAIIKEIVIIVLYFFIVLQVTDDFFKLFTNLLSFI